MKRGSTWVRWFWLGIILYMMFTVGRLAYRNYRLNIEEAGLNQDVQKLQNEIQNLKNQIVYFQSDSYKEKMLRAKLNLQKPGEKVVVIPPEPEVTKVPEAQPEKLTNPQKWWRYFFGG